MINRYVGVGRITKDPQIRHTGSGAAVTSFTVAINRDYKNDNGEQQADFINCICWNKLAENVERYCSKGSLVGIDGSLRSRTYEDNSGRKVYVVEVLCDSVQFLDTKKEQQQQTTQNMYKPVEKNNSFNSFDIEEDDIQF